MERELIVNSGKEGVEIAFVEDRHLVEYHVDNEDSKFNVGDIYLGRVRKINPGLNAAFVDVGFVKDAFLHYTDLGPKFRSLFRYTQRAIKGSQRSSKLHDFRLEPEIIKTGKMGQVITKQQNILVQVLKEPISSKGPRITSEITLAGRYVIVTPFNGSVGISRRIVSAKERSRLQVLLESIVPKNFGVIARTAAEGQNAASLAEDIMNLVAQWEEVHKKLKNAKANDLIFSESRKVNTLIRDFLGGSSFQKIVVNDLLVLQDIREYLEKVAPDQVGVLQFHQSRKPIFDVYGVTKQIKSLFGETVSLRSGAYLVIQHTEAMHVIDINSGPKITRRADQESNAVSVNVETAREVARQLRLRDLGGIIIIDFIDMRNPENKKKLFKVMRDSMENDRAKHSILPISKFGLMQITRQRARPEVNIVTQERCPSCNGTGKVAATLLLIDDIENKLEGVIKANAAGKVRLHVHPFVEAFLTKGLWNSRQFAWWKKYRKWVKIYPNSNFTFSECHFLDGKDDEIVLEL